MKKKLFVIAAIAIVLSILAGGTLAYYTSDIFIHNVITSSSVGIHIEEYQLVDGVEKPYPENGVSIMPGSLVSKRPEVVNDEAPSYIRACVEVVVKLDGQRTYTTLTEAEAAEIMTFTMNTADWQRKEGDNKWWYYMPGSVGTDEATTPLFTEVSFKGAEMGNEYMNAEIRINIAGQAVQSDNNPIEEGKEVWDVKGWPKVELQG